MTVSSTSRLVRPGDRVVDTESDEQRAHGFEPDAQRRADHTVITSRDVATAFSRRRIVLLTVILGGWR